MLKNKTIINNARSLLSFFIIFILSISINNNIITRPAINLFWPSDRPLQPNFWPCNGWQFNVAYEGAINVDGYQADDEEICDKICQRRTNVLQIWQDKQNLTTPCYLDTINPNFSCHDDHSILLNDIFCNQNTNGVLAQFIPKADLHIPLNLLLSLRYYFRPNITLGFYLPVLSTELNNIRFTPCNENLSNFAHEESLLGDCSLNNIIYDLTCIDIQSYKRSGVGDLLAQFMWLEDFPQPKPILRNVRLQTRFGLFFPTGKRTDENLLLAFPFGNDGAWAFQGAFGMELSWAFNLRFGVDAEFLYLIGDTKKRRIKTTFCQTDLLFPIKEDTFKYYGLNQQYNLFLEYIPHIRGLFFRVNYQYLTQNENHLYVKSNLYDTRIINSAESLQEWATHSMIFQANYDFYYESREKDYTPSISLFYKKGFNAKRAILIDSVGFRLTVDF